MVSRRKRSMRYLNKHILDSRCYEGTTRSLFRTSMNSIEDLRKLFSRWFDFMQHWLTLNWFFLLLWWSWWRWRWSRIWRRTWGRGRWGRLLFYLNAVWEFDKVNYTTFVYLFKVVWLCTYLVTLDWRCSAIFCKSPQSKSSIKFFTLRT